jgi:aspartate/methionine/tyrosine aminotransferase
VDRAGSLKDRSILRLENLDTDIPPPQDAIDVTKRVLASDWANSYLPFRGQDALREAVCAHVARLSGIAYNWRQSCVITPGGLSGIFSALLAILDPGDEVILTDPIYVGLLNRVLLAGGVPRLVPFRFERSGWRLDLGAMQRAAT